MPKATCRHLDGCPRPARKLGWCSMHYNRIRAHGDPGPPGKLNNHGEAVQSCRVVGCALTTRRYIAGFCEVHYQRNRVTGKPGQSELIRLSRVPEEQRGWTTSQRHRFYKYGLTPEDFDRILAAQGGRCYICRTDTPTAKGWSVDHCHQSNAVRFIACNPCNVALGLIREDPKIGKRLYEVALECQQLRFAI